MISENNISRRATSGIARWLGALVLATVWLAHSPITSAEFYPRNDHLGRKHLSNLPPRSFDRNGEIRRAYDPNSIVYQHQRMLEALAAQSAVIAQAREQEARETENRAAALEALHAPPVRRPPREGNMNLDELIRWRNAVGCGKETSTIDLRRTYYLLIVVTQIMCNWLDCISRRIKVIQGLLGNVAAVNVHADSRLFGGVDKIVNKLVGILHVGNIPGQHI